jgi:hypothetical protein
MRTPVIKVQYYFMSRTLLILYLYVWHEIQVVSKLRSSASPAKFQNNLGGAQRNGDRHSWIHPTDDMKWLRECKVPWFKHAPQLYRLHHTASTTTKQRRRGANKPSRRRWKTAYRLCWRLNSAGDWKLVSTSGPCDVQTSCRNCTASDKH